MTTEYTPNFRFNLPDFRMGPWHDLVNTNTTRIDQLLLAIYQGIDTSPWQNNFSYTPGQTAIDIVDNSFWVCSVTHTSAPAPTTFAQDRAAHPTYWVRSVVGLNPRGQWVNNRLYFVNDLVSDATQGIIAVCITQHTSNAAGTIRNDAAYWTFLVDMTGGLGNQATYVAFDPLLSSIPNDKVNVQTAMDYLSSKNDSQDTGINSLDGRLTTNEALDVTQNTRLTALEALPVGVPEAPNDAKMYGRKSLTWQEVPGGFTDAPADGALYGRVNNAWVQAVKRAGDSMTGTFQATQSGLASSYIGLSTLIDTNVANWGYASILGHVNAAAYSIAGFRTKMRASVAGMGTFQHTGDGTYMIAGIYGWVPTGGHGANAIAGFFDRPDGVGHSAGNSYSVIAGGLGQGLGIYDWIAAGFTFFANADGATYGLAPAAGDSSARFISSAFLTGAAIRADRAQTLTDAQKSQARANAGVTKKNYILNGGIMYSQENGDSAGVTSGYYPADGFVVNYGIAAPGAVSIQRMVNTPNSLVQSTHRIRVICTTAQAAPAAGNYMLINQRLEGLRVADLCWGQATAKAITIQFIVRAPAGTYSVCVQNGAFTRSYIATYTISAGEANTDVLKSVQIPGDTTGSWPVDTTPSISVNWMLTAGSTFHAAAGVWAAGNLPMAVSTQFNLFGTVNNAFWLSDVGVYEGTVPPPFELPDVVTELQKCRRYYQYVDAALDAVGSGAGVNSAHGISFPVAMRAAPTLTFQANTGPSNCTTATAYVNSNGFAYQTTSSAAGRFYAYGRYICNARL